jgi:serine/threonine-protein kinase
MSPEQLAGKRVDGRSDLYSLGVMLFQLLTGVLPFKGDSLAELMFKIANEEAADVRTIRPDLSETLANIVAMSMRKKPDIRYQTGEHFAQDLRSVLNQSNVYAASSSSMLKANMAPTPESEKTVAFASTVPNPYANRP